MSPLEVLVWVAVVAVAAITIAAVILVVAAVMVGTRDALDRQEGDR